MKTTDRIIVAVKLYTLTGILLTGCSYGNGMKDGNASQGMNGWSWPLGVGIGLACLFAYVLWLGLRRKKK